MDGRPVFAERRNDVPAAGTMAGSDDFFGSDSADFPANRVWSIGPAGIMGNLFDFCLRGIFKL